MARGFWICKKCDTENRFTLGTPPLPRKCWTCGDEPNETYSQHRVEPSKTIDVLTHDEIQLRDKNRLRKKQSFYQGSVMLGDLPTSAQRAGVRGFDGAIGQFSALQNKRNNL